MIDFGQTPMRPMKRRLLRAIVEKKAFSREKALEAKALLEATGIVSFNSLTNHWSTIHRKLRPAGGEHVFPTPGSTGESGKYCSTRPIRLLNDSPDSAGPSS